MSDLTATITEAAYANGVPPQLALAQASQESSLNPSAVNSKTGAAGLFQLEPGTAADLGVADPLDPLQSSQGGTAYLSQLYSEFGDWATALAAYDWGPTNVSKAQATHGADWLSYAPAETQDYVSNILTNSGMDSLPSQPTTDASAPVTSDQTGADIASAPPSEDFAWAWWALGLGGLAIAWAVAK